MTDHLADPLEKKLPNDKAITVDELLEHPLLRPAAIRLVCAVSKLLKFKKNLGQLDQYEVELYREIRRNFFDLSQVEKHSAFDLPTLITESAIDEDDL